MMSIIKRLEDAASYGPVPCPVAKEAADLIGEIYGYLIAASESTMSRNNSENLALELIEKIEA